MLSCLLSPVWNSPHSLFFSPDKNIFWYPLYTEDTLIWVYFIFNFLLPGMLFPRMSHRRLTVSCPLGCYISTTSSMWSSVAPWLLTCRNSLPLSCFGVHTIKNQVTHCTFFLLIFVSTLSHPHTPILTS